MVQQISVKEAERKVFRIKINDGLWDVFLGCWLLMFVIGPYLSQSLGDFWSSAIFLPFWGMIYLVIWLIRKYVVTPRMGVVKFGQPRIRKLKRFTGVMLILNILALILGFVAALSFGKTSGWIYTITFSMIFLTGFSLAAYFLDFPRLYLYGLMTAIGPLAGEWLFKAGLVSHHGYPIIFGMVSGIMILTGSIIFIRLLHSNSAGEDQVGVRKQKNG
jgi:hypothetical protein